MNFLKISGMKEDIKIEFTKKLPLINTNYNSTINEIIEELKKNKLVQYNEHKENYLVLMKTSCFNDSR